MANSNSDFLDWDDINLDVLFEEYTCDDSSSDDEFCSKKFKNKGKTTERTKPDKNGTYICDMCVKSYISISGIRGHMRTKHGMQNVKGKLSLLKGL